MIKCDYIVWCFLLPSEVKAVSVIPSSVQHSRPSVFPVSAEPSRNHLKVWVHCMYEFSANTLVSQSVNI